MNKPNFLSKKPSQLNKTQKKLKEILFTIKEKVRNCKNNNLKVQPRVSTSRM